jgi:hypothetical protein
VETWRVEFAVPVVNLGSYFLLGQAFSVEIVDGVPELLDGGVVLRLERWASPLLLFVDVCLGVFIAEVLEAFLLLVFCATQGGLGGLLGVTSSIVSHCDIADCPSTAEK